MSDTVYAIASGKGGVGKTTTAVNLGATLADRGNSVVVLDTDLGMANLAGFLDFEVEDPTLHEVLAGEADPEDAIYEAPGDVHVLPSSTDIEAFAKSDPSNLQDVVADLHERYDYVLLDTGAGVSYDTLIPLAVADAVLLVATPDVASVRDTAKTGELAERVGSTVAGAILTKRSSDILNAADVEETLGTDVLAVIPQDEAVPMGIDAGRPLSVFAPNAPAGRAYHDLAAILDGEAVPDLELDAPAESASEVEAGSETASEDEAGTAAQDDSAAGDPLEAIETVAPDADTSSADGTDAENPNADVDAGWSEDPFADADAGGTGDEPSKPSDPAANDSEDATSADTGDRARSVDDLISQHIDDDRLDNDDPLASVGESLDGAGNEVPPTEGETEAPPTEGETDVSEANDVAGADDADESEDADDGTAVSPSGTEAEEADATPPSEADDPLSVGEDGDSDADPATETEAASDSDSTAADDSGSDDTAGEEPLGSEPSDAGPVPFEGEGPSEDVSSVERDAQRVGGDSEGETVLAEDAAGEESASETDGSDPDVGDSDSGSDEAEPDSESDSKRGVLGRLGSLFR